MVVKVGHINPILFRSSNYSTKPQNKVNTEKRSVEILNITPDYTVKAPQKYTLIGVNKTENGLNIYSYKLANGHRVSIVPMEDSPATVKNYVNVGSMNETDNIKGISHFLEHMAFNGTEGTDGYLKLETGDSFNKIDKIGGWTNASTNYALTDYVNSSQLLDNKDLETQIKVMAAMTENLALTPEMIEKEKGPVTSEIDMILDNPNTIAIDQTVRSLFNIKSSADELVGGSVEHIRNITKDDVKNYYEKYYTPDNMHLVVTGNVNPNEVMELVSKNFHSTRTTQPDKRYEAKLEPVKSTIRKDFISDKANSATIIIGFAGQKTDSTKENIIFDIISQYLYSTNSGIKKEFNRINADYTLGAEKISTNRNNPYMLYFGIDCADKDSEEALKIFFDKVSAMKAPDEESLKQIKVSLKQTFNEILEYSAAVNDMVGKSYFEGDTNYIYNYEKILDSITSQDIKDYINKYLDVSKSAVTVVHPVVDKQTVFENYEKAKQLSFRGTKRKPVNTDKLSQQTLDNNYAIGFVESNNNNIPFHIKLKFELPENINPAAKYVLNEIYSKGSIYRTETELDNFKEKNNLSASITLNTNYLSANGYSSYENFDKAADTVMEILNNPRINDEEFKNSVERVKSQLERRKPSAKNLYNDYRAQTNINYDSKNGILNALNTLTKEDVVRLHNYILENSKGIITINVPQTHPDIKENAIKKFENLHAVKPYSYEPTKIYEDNDKPVVLTKARKVSQADISQIYRYKTDNNIKDIVVGTIMNSILSSSHSIGLFNTLREKEHLAYTVRSNIHSNGNEGEVSLNILTSTDNTDTGEKTYENLQKSINGFNRQIGELLNSNYTDEDLEIAKRSMKAQLLNKESVALKMASLEKSIYYDEGVDYENKAYELIDTITREDIDNFAKKVFGNNPTYSIVATQDTLDYNAEFLKSLEG